MTLFGVGPRWIRLENDLVWVETEEDWTLDGLGLGWNGRGLDRTMLGLR